MHIVESEQISFIMEMLGFEKRFLEDKAFVDEFYVVDSWKIDLNDFMKLKCILDDIFRLNNITPLTKNLVTPPPELKK